jgi:hypothetical protein
MDEKQSQISLSVAKMTVDLLRQVFDGLARLCLRSESGAESHACRIILHAKQFFNLPDWFDWLASLRSLLRCKRRQRFSIGLSVLLRVVF